MNQQIDYREGSFVSWFEEEKVDYKRIEFIPLAFHFTPEGAVAIFKDSSKVRFIHAINGESKVELTCEVGHCDPKQKHMIAATWSKSGKSICLYLDGVKKAEEKFL